MENGHKNAIPVENGHKSAIPMENGHKSAIPMENGHKSVIHERRVKARAPTMHSLAQAGDVNSLQVLLERNPSLINDRNPVMVQTPLHVAASSNQAESAKLLLDWPGPEKCEIEARNMYGETPLHLAAKNGCTNVLKVLVEHNACLEARASNGMTPLHLAVWYSIWNEDISAVEALLYYNADIRATDNEGLTALNHLPKNLGKGKKLYYLLEDHLERQRKEQAMKACEDSMRKMEFLDAELQKIVGLHDLKLQLHKWAKGMLLDERRRALGLKVAPRNAPHMAFLGNPGTGKTMIARLLGKLLHIVGVLPTDKVVEVQRTDLVGAFVGHTGPRTRRKVKEAAGGILFVDEAYRLMPLQKSDDKDYGLEALEEIMSVMDNGSIVVIFAGYCEPMKRVILCNEGFRRRVTKYFYFDDFNTREIAEILHLKMREVEQDSTMYGFKLHNSCTIEAIARLLDQEMTETQRKELNGGLVWPMLLNAREILDHRLDLGCNDKEELVTITFEDLRVGLDVLMKSSPSD